MTRRPPQAVVIGDSDPSPEAYLAAEEAGRILASLGITVVTGGRSGIMEAACKGAKAAGGMTVGILPSDELSDANQYCDVVIPTGLSHGRNAITVLAGDCIIAIGGGAGTLSEISFAWMHNKPIFTLKGYGGWADTVGGSALDQRSDDVIIECQNIDDLRNKVINICNQFNLPIKT